MNSQFFLGTAANSLPFIECTAPHCRFHAEIHYLRKELIRYVCNLKWPIAAHHSAAFLSIFLVHRKYVANSREVQYVLISQSTSQRMSAASLGSSGRQPLEIIGYIIYFGYKENAMVLPLFSTLSCMTCSKWLAPSSNRSSQTLARAFSLVWAFLSWKMWEVLKEPLLLNLEEEDWGNAPQPSERITRFYRALFPCPLTGRISSGNKGDLCHPLVRTDCLGRFWAIY